MKSKVDELYVDKLVPVPVDLSKLSDLVKIMMLKIMIKTMITNLATNTTLNPKANKVKNKIPTIT